MVAKKLFLFFLISVCCLFFSSCEKESGEGGTSSISGKVFKLKVNTFTGDTTYFHPYNDREVYIIYSNNENDIYDDSFETNWNGQYEFNYLRKGDYTLFTYEDSTDNIGVNYEYPVFLHVTVDKNNLRMDNNNFIINK